MLRHVLFELSLFSPEDDPDRARIDLCWLLEALTQRNQSYLRDHPETPLLYASGVRYALPKQFGGDCEEVQVLRRALGGKAKDSAVADVLELIQSVFGGERFCDVRRIIEKGEIDCDGLACWRAAELRNRGIRATPYITWRERPGGGTTYHAIARWPDGTSEDPSLLLGMGGPEREADRQEERRKNGERKEVAEAVVKYGSRIAPTAIAGFLRQYRERCPLQLREASANG